VKYKLWPLTFALLKHYRSGDPETVLLTTGGKKWIEEGMAEDYKRSDKVASCFKYWNKRAGVNKPPSKLRNTAATLLGDHLSYKFYTQYFLAQSPKTVTDKHYLIPSEAEFFAALEWLDGRLGLK
jgi:hypothetical protein